MVDRIMLVEDEVIVAMDLEHRLETLGYIVNAHATSYHEAVNLANLENPDLILMDIKIRGSQDGIDAALKIHEHMDVPVIYITAYADEVTVRRASRSQAYGYLIKPFEDRELRSTIELALYKHKMERKLRESEERYALAARAANDGIWDWNLLNGEVYYSPRWCSLVGLSEDAPVSQSRDWFDRVHPEDLKRLEQAIANHFKGVTPTVDCEYRIRHQDGSYRWMACRGIALFDSEQRPYRLAGSQTDITMRKRFEDELSHRALHDDLTGLPNRALFLDRLGVTFERVRNSRQNNAAILFLDIDHFKLVNDSLGHINGDELLKAFAGRVQGCVHSCDTVARFGGDEFAILVDYLPQPAEAREIAERIHQALARPFLIHGLEIISSVSIGIVYITDEYTSVNDLMRDVDVAMYHAKYNGRGRYEIFETRMHERMINRLRLESEIRRGIEQNEFILYYQPVFHLPERSLIGFEALIRWKHPLHGVLMPTDFISVAEESGLINPLGDFVLLAACKQAREWQRLTGKALKMAVNLSAAQFTDEHLLERIQAAIEQSGLDPALLELELTESTAMHNLDKVLQVLHNLQNSGLSISMDDFGSGYSSLDHIRHFPINTLKIDRSFINDIGHSDAAIVEAIVTMAHQLKLKVIAEGVENQAQLDVLERMQCDQVQGYYLGRPLPPEEVVTTMLVKETPVG